MRQTPGSLLAIEAHETRIDPQARALVVFVGRTRLRWLAFLRPGFRHCFVIIEDGGGCIVSDPLANRTIIGHLEAVTLDMACGYCWQQGYTVIETSIGGASTACASLMRPFTCVEFVKRVLCLVAPAVVTPWQLYRMLRTRQGDVELGLDGARHKRLYSYS